MSPHFLKRNTGRIKPETNEINYLICGGWERGGKKGEMGVGQQDEEGVNNFSKLFNCYT